MEQTIPEDIRKDADEKYPRSLYSGTINVQKMYIQGRMDERVRHTPVVISWLVSEDPTEMFGYYLQQYYEPCETLGMWQLKSGVQSHIQEIYLRWKEKFNIQEKN